MGYNYNPKRKVLIDADIVAFKVSSATQNNFDFSSDFDDADTDGATAITTDVEAAWKHFQTSIDKIEGDCGAGAGIVLTLTCPKHNWRKDVLPTYKGNRKKTERPLVLEEIRMRAEAFYETYIRDNMEADDVLGILQTNKAAMPFETVIASIDKDLLTIPGKHWNFDKKQAVTMSPAQSNYFFLTQCLTGDVTDGYKGCPGIGPKKTERLLAPYVLANPDGNIRKGIAVEDTRAVWDEAILPTYEAKGLTEEDALQQARVARICHSSDYNFKTKEVILWTP